MVSTRQSELRTCAPHGPWPLPLNLPAWLRMLMQSQSIMRELMYVMMQMRGNSASCGHCPGQGTISVMLDGETESAAATMHDTLGVKIRGIWHT